MFQRIPWRIWTPAVGLLLGASWIGFSWHQKNVEIRLLQSAVQAERALRDTARVKVATVEADRDLYAGLYAAARQVKGKPVAGAVIRIPVWDTVIVHDTVATDLFPDQTRVGHFRDSSDNIVVDATIEAPPCCQPLRVRRLQITRPEFAPTVGFLRAGDRVLATVEWGTSEVSIEAPFFDPPKPPRWERWVDVLGDPDAVTVRLGSSFRVYKGWHAQVVADRRFQPNIPATLEVGARYRW